MCVFMTYKKMGNATVFFTVPVNVNLTKIGFVYIDQFEICRIFNIYLFVIESKFNEDRAVTF